MIGLSYVALLLLIFFPLNLFAVERPHLPVVQLQIDFVPAPNGPRNLKGKMTLTNIDGLKEKDVCFYLPYQDPEYGANRGDMHRFQMLTSTHRKPLFSGGSLKVVGLKNAKVLLTPWKHIIQLQLPNGWDDTSSLNIDFEAQVPRLERSRGNEWVYDGFFPQLMQKCPGALEYLPDVSQNRASFYDVSIKVPDGWTYLGLGSTHGQSVQLQSPMTYPGFLLVQGFKQAFDTFEKIPITIAYQSDSFLDLRDTITSSLKEMSELFGPYPYQSITIVESSELQRHGIPGIVSINRPPQLIFDKVQKDLLNWQHWITTLQLSKQWAGALVYTKSPDDEWLLSGISEYATLRALSKNPRRFDLFNDNFWGKKYFTFSYLQQSEILTSMLKKNSPYSMLTTSDGVTLERHSEQDKLLFLRHTAAIRQVQTIVGDTKLNGYLRKFFADFAFKSASPQEFLDHLGKLPSPFSEIQRAEITKYFKSWWTLDGWPDFSIAHLNVKPLPNGQYSIEVHVEQKGVIDHPPIIAVMGNNGRLYRHLAKKDEALGFWVAQYILNTDIDWVEIDPYHEQFDSDRFNNSTRPTKLYFFPGSATTIADDAYTFVWVPYPFRRPGEDLSIGIQGGIFKYVQGALMTGIEYSPSSKKNAYLVNYNYQWDHKSFTNGFLVQKKQDSNREFEINFTDQNVTKSAHALSLGGMLKRKDLVGQESSIHGSYGFKVGFKPPGDERMCLYNFTGSYEKAPSNWSEGFSYERSLASLLGECRITYQIGYSAKAFIGRMSGNGLLPESAFFKPNELSEAKLRIDIGLDRVSSINSIANDFSFPLYLPLPFDFLILSRQLRWRLFYDIGHAPKENIDYSSTGTGFQLPIGGDLSGAGSLAFTKLTFLVALHSRAGDKTVKQPSILFDFSGQL